MYSQRRITVFTYFVTTMIQTNQFIWGDLFHASVLTFGYLYDIFTGVSTRGISPQACLELQDTRIDTTPTPSSSNKGRHLLVSLFRSGLGLSTGHVQELLLRLAEGVHSWGIKMQLQLRRTTGGFVAVFHRERCVQHAT